MGFLSQKIEKSQLVVGDHIYTWRSAYPYSHHGIFVGRNKVIHFTVFGQNSSTRSSGIFSSSSPLSSTCCNVPLCGFRRPESGVVLSCLNCFLGEGSLYRFEYGVSWSFFLAKVRGGTCTTAESDPPKSVISRAVNLLQDGFGKYNVLMNNCEDFAIYCKTGSKVLNKNTTFRSAVRLVVLGFSKSN